MKKIVPCLISFLLAPSLIAAHAETLGRFFFTPTERTQLDRIRAGMPAEPVAIKPDTVTHTAKINGYVARSDGKSTVWLNGEPISAQESNMTLHPSAVRGSSEIIVSPSQRQPLRKNK